MRVPSSDLKPVNADIHKDIVKDVDAYIAKNQKPLRKRGLHDKTKLIRWFFLELTEGRIDPCRKS